MVAVTGPIPTRRDAGTSTQELLFAAAAAEMAASGHRDLTVRLVARRAGVSPATAYKVFSSKEHLVAAVLLRRLQGLPAVDPADPLPVAERLPAFVRGFAGTLLADPELRAALGSVFGSDDPDSARIRELVVADVTQRFEAVCRDDLADPARRTVLLAFAGLMVSAGAGLMAFSDLPGAITEVLGTVQGPDR